jgi:hypothetical protein
MVGGDVQRGGQSLDFDAFGVEDLHGNEADRQESRLKCIFG